MSAASTPFSIGAIPALGTVLPARMSQNTLAIPANRPDRAKAPRITESERTPMSRAVSKSAAAARRDRPKVVCCSTNVVPNNVARVTTMTTVSKTSTRSDPSAYVSVTHPGRGKVLTDADT